MGDFRDLLGRGVGDFDPQPDEGLERTLERARRRHRNRQVLAGILALGLFGGTLAGAVALRDPEDRPIAGPTTSPSTSPPPDEPTSCSSGFRNTGRVCLTRTSEIVEVASGEAAGERWSLQAFVAAYRGPMLGERGLRSGTHVKLAFLCTRMRFAGRDMRTCDRASGHGSVWGIGGFGNALLDPAVPPVDDPPTTDDNPLQGLEGSGGGFAGTTVEEGSLRWGWTPEETVSVRIEPDEGEPSEAVLVGPFPELRTRVRWAVAFVPVGSERVRVTAYDATGVLWRENDTLLSVVSVAKSGSGSGNVTGFWTWRLQNPGPHPPTVIIDCGRDCWYAFEPEGGDFTLRATPDEGSEFAHWRGPCAGQGATCRFDLRDTTTVTAVFDREG
jgi:hypothetical protein